MADLLIVTKQQDIIGYFLKIFFDTLVVLSCFLKLENKQ